MLSLTQALADEFIRGVSGGERKRVSIAEMFCSRATVCAWDNSTRGLDASTALDYAKSLRILTDITKYVTPFQSTNAYELMTTPAQDDHLCLALPSR